LLYGFFCACGRGGSLFEKSSAKTFFEGTAVGGVIFGREALLLCQSETQTGKRKRAFFCPSVSRAEGILIASDKNPPKMTWIAPRRSFFGGVKRKFSIGLLRGCKPSLQKFLRSFFQKATLRAAAPPRPQAQKKELTQNQLLEAFIFLSRPPRKRGSGSIPKP